MPIFDQGYQHWHGHLSGHSGRWLAIARRGIKAQLRGRWTRMVLLVSLAPALALAGATVLWGLFEQKSSLIMPLVNLLEGLPDEIKTGPRQFRQTMWTIAFFSFFQVQLSFSMLLALFVGPSLISQDLRFNAIPLYFSRPLTRFDYFLGKFGVIAAYLAAVSILPVLLAYVLGVCFSLDPSVIPDTARLLGASLLYAIVVVLAAGTLMLALSALSRNSRYVGVMWIGIWIVGNTLAGVLYGPLRARWGLVASFTADLERLCAWFLDTDRAWTQLGSFGHSPDGHNIFEKMIDPFPWYWSAGVLAAFFGISIWILTVRVKTLDRLK